MHLAIGVNGKLEYYKIMKLVNSAGTITFYN